MKDLLPIDSDDRKLWVGIFVVGLPIIIFLSVFTGVPLVASPGRFLMTLSIMYLPGYIIYKLFFNKLFFNKLKLFDYTVLDQFLSSLFSSIASVSPQSR